MLKNNSFIRRNWRVIVALVTYLIDSLAIFTCGTTTWYLLSRFYPGPVTKPTAALLLVISFWAILSFFALVIGLYRQLYPLNSSSHYLLAAKSYVYAVAFILISFYFLHLVNIPRSFILLCLVLIPIHFIIGRGLLTLLHQVFQHIGLGIHNVLLLLDGKTTDSIPRQLIRLPSLGYNIRGLLVNSKESRIKNGHFLGKEVPIYTLSQIDNIIPREEIDRIFIPSTSFVVNGFHDIIEKCKHHQIKLKVVSPEASSLLRMARVHDLAGITLYTTPRWRIELAKRVIKRIFDVIGATILILMLSPVFLLTSIAIFIESGWPIYYTQRRASVKGGKEFKFIKFRSMIHGAEKIREYLSDLNEASGALFKMKNDPRMTKVGRFIRKFSIDELPQLFNVLIGDMSLVGPRPLPIEDFEKVKVENDFWEAISDRAKAKPGITGLWQISGRSDLSFNEMVLLDLYYVEHQSLIFDLEILFETIPAVLFSRGAY
ncbi:MAG: sugar transferase [Candidatus Neomarinimicrobiota bacterium]